MPAPSEHPRGFVAASTLRPDSDFLIAGEWLFAQVDRLLKVNALRAVTKELVEAAREGLVIGPV